MNTYIIAIKNDDMENLCFYKLNNKYDYKAKCSYYAKHTDYAVVRTSPNTFEAVRAIGICELEDEFEEYYNDGTVLKMMSSDEWEKG